MSRHLDDFPDDTVVMLVTFTAAPELRRYLRWSGIEYPALLDPERTTYAAYGLGRAPRRKVWSLKVARRYLGILAGRRLSRLRLPVEDTRQLGGDFVIDRQGDLAAGFWSDGPDDRPSIRDLVEAVRRCD